LAYRYTKIDVFASIHNRFIKGTNLLKYRPPNKHAVKLCQLGLFLLKLVAQVGNPPTLAVDLLPDTASNVFAFGVQPNVSFSTGTMDFFMHRCALAN